VNQISQEALNGFVPNSQGRCVWSRARTSLNVKVKGQGDEEWKALAANDIKQQQTAPFRRCRV